MTYNLPEGFDLRAVDPSAVPDVVDRLVWIWVQDNPSDHMPHQQHRKELIEQHSQCRGFRCFTASREGDIVGFAYGMYEYVSARLGNPGETVSVGTRDFLKEGIAMGVVNPKWLDSFDIGELQVLREHRHKGIGTGLVRKLCEGLSSNRVVLSVAEGAEDARSIYEGLGFEGIYSTIPSLFPRVRQTVMGTTLPLKDEAETSV